MDEVGEVRGLLSTDRGGGTDGPTDLCPRAGRGCREDAEGLSPPLGSECIHLTNAGGCSVPGTVLAAADVAGN